MPHKPLRQLAAEKARGNRPANPSQLGDPIDLKAETSDRAPDDTVEPDLDAGHARQLRLPRAALGLGLGDDLGPGAGGSEGTVTVVGIGEGAGPVGGVPVPATESRIAGKAASKL